MRKDYLFIVPDTNIKYYQRGISFAFFVLNIQPEWDIMGISDFLHHYSDKFLSLQDEYVSCASAYLLPEDKKAYDALISKFQEHIEGRDAVLDEK